MWRLVHAVRDGMRNDFFLFFFSLGAREQERPIAELLQACELSARPRRRSPFDM